MLTLKSIKTMQFRSELFKGVEPLKQCHTISMTKQQLTRVFFQKAQ